MLPTFWQLAQPCRRRSRSRTGWSLWIVYDARTNCIRQHKFESKRKRPPQSDTDWIASSPVKGGAPHHYPRISTKEKKRNLDKESCHWPQALHNNLCEPRSFSNCRITRRTAAIVLASVLQFARGHVGIAHASKHRSVDCILKGEWRSAPPWWRGDSRGTQPVFFPQKKERKKE